SCLHPTARVKLAARRSHWRAVYRVNLGRSSSHARGARDHERSVARLRAGEFARKLARRHGEIHSRALRPDFPDALHDQWPHRARSDFARIGVRKAAAEAARADTT